MSIYYSKREGEKEISISFDKSEDFFKYLEWLDREAVEEKEIVIAPLDIKQDSEEEFSWIKWESCEDFEGVPEGLNSRDVVQVEFRDGVKSSREIDASRWNWETENCDADIVAYKVIKKYKEEQEV